MSDIVHNKFRKGTRFNVNWPSIPSLKGQPIRIDLIQKQYNHDVAILEYSVVSPLYIEAIKTGVLVEFSWSQEGLNRSWVGYVSSIDRVVNSRRDIVMKIHCVGASYPLKQRVTTVFTNCSIPEAVESIAKEFGLKYDGINHPRKFNQLTIAGQSYWDWIQEQARRIGYALLVNGTTMTFKPIDSIINERFSSTPVMSFNPTPTVANSMYLDRTLDYFKALNGEHIENVPELRMKKIVGGVDPITNKQFVAVSSPESMGDSMRDTPNDVLFNDFKTDEVANGGNSVQLAADGYAHSARFSMPADVKGQGDPRLIPFGTVLIKGTGDLTDGYWLVKEVKHILHRSGDYVAELKVLSDGFGKTTNSTFRNRDNTRHGSVNLNEALKNKNSVLFTRNMAKPVFITNIKKVSGQGYNRTPARWKAE